MIPTRRKYGPKYVGGCFILPLDPSKCCVDETESQPSICPSTDENGDQKPTLDALLDLILDILGNIIPHVRSFLYLLYPVSIVSWLYSSSHTRFMFQLYSALNRLVAQRSENPMLDIEIYPVFFPDLPVVPDVVHILPNLQFDALASLLTVNDPSTIRFIERKTPDGPVGIFRLLPEHDRAREMAFSSFLPVEVPHRPVGDKDNPSSPTWIPFEPRYGFPFSKSVLNVCYSLSDSSPRVVDAFDFVTENLNANTLPPPRPPGQTRPFIAEQPRIERMPEVKLPPIEPFDSTLFAGTFDHLHSGHKFLLWMVSVMSQSQLTIGVVSDDGYLLDDKVERGLVEPFDYRVLRIIEFVQRSLHLLNVPVRVDAPPTFVMRFKSKLCPKIAHSNNPMELHPLFNSPSSGEALAADKRLLQEKPVYPRGLLIRRQSEIAEYLLAISPIVQVEIVELLDPSGPAVYQDFGCLVVTNETRRGGDAVNAHRRREGLGPIWLVELPLVENQEVKKEQPEAKPAEHEAAESKVETAKDETTETKAEAPKHETAEVKPIKASSSSLTFEHKLSSSLIRRQITATPVIEDLREQWELIASTLKLPTSMSAVWSLRLLELFSLPWRKRNRSRLKQMIDQLWSRTQPQLQTSARICPTDKAWLSIAFWLALCIISEEVRSEQWKVEQRIARQKLDWMVLLFCDDYYLSMSLGLGPKIRYSWRGQDSRLPKLTGPYANFINKEIQDLRHNLACVGEYLLMSFIPKHQQIELEDTHPHGDGAKTFFEIIHEHEDAELKHLHGNDLLHHFQQTIDYFVYEFFQRSYHNEYAPLIDNVNTIGPAAYSTPHNV